MKVSIVTPSFNGARWIAETIASIQAQTYSDIEHIVVDGGSTDGTLDIVRAHPGIKLVVGKDKGMYDAINKGFAIATGDVFAYLNTDDLYYPDSVQRALAALAADPAANVVYSDIELIDEHGAGLGVYKTPRDLDFATMASFPVSLVPQPASFWTRKAFETVGGFDDSFRVIGDFEFFLKMAKLGPLRHVGRPLAQFRLVSTSLTMSNSARIRAETSAIQQTYGIMTTPLQRVRSLGIRLRLAVTNWRGRARRNAALYG
jgi:glycosyltransferase involved in cell wall biosynthesis